MKLTNALFIILIVMSSMQAEAVELYSFKDVIPDGKSFMPDSTLDLEMSDPIVSAALNGKLPASVKPGMVPKFDVFYRKPFFNAAIRLESNNEECDAQFEFIAQSYKDGKDSTSQKTTISGVPAIIGQSFGTKIIYFKLRNVIVGVIPMEKTIDDSLHLFLAKKYIQYLIQR